MPDFFPPNRELTIEEIVELTGAKPRPDTPLDRRIRDIAPLDRARSTDITFLDNPKYLDGARDDARRRLPDGAALCRAGARQACRAGRARALSRFRHGCARALSRGAAAVLAVRYGGPLAGSAHSSLRPAGSGRHGRSAGGDRAARPRSAPER